MKTTFFAMLAAIMLFTACGGGESDKQDEGMQNEGTEQMDSNGEATQAVFYCPMKCEGEKTYAEPGTCPVCGMDLVEQGAADDGHMEDGHMHEGDHEGHDHGNMDEGEESSY
ncbi:hypothetical protein KQI65_16905 [bacterium]|nr:hypothetical protein [bacterium]